MLEDIRKNWKNAIWDYLLMIAIIIAVYFIVCTNLFHYCYKMNADIASEGVLARLIWESGEWMPKSWYAGSELRLWQTPNLAALFYGLTHSMILAMGISCTIMTIGIALSAFFFISQLPFERVHKLAFVLLCLIMPNHFVILELVYLFASYYAIHVIIMFYTLGIYIKCMNGKHNTPLSLIAAVIIALMMGMLSVREILILYAPLFMAEIIRQLFLIYKGTWKDKNNLFIGGWCLSLVAASFIGTCFPFSVSQGVSRNIRKGFTKLLKSVFPDVVKCMGFPDTNTLETVIFYIIIVLVILGLFLCIKRIIRKQDENPAVWAYLMLCFSPVLTMLAAAFTTMESSERYYFVIIYALSFGFVYLIKEIKQISKIIQNVLYTLILILFVIHIKSIYLPIMQSDEPYPNAQYEVCRYLENNEYKAAYADFENANTLTVLSDGAVRVAAIDSMEKMNVNKCLSSNDWYVPNVPYESQTVYIITETEMEAFDKFYKQHEEEFRLLIQIDKYLLFVSDYNFTYID